MNYLLTGQEEYSKRQFLEKLKKTILNNTEDTELDFEVFHAGAQEITKILDSLNTLPFISKKKLIVIKDIDKFETTEKDSILEYLKSPRDSTVLVLESPLDEFSKPLQEISRFAKLVRCKRLNSHELKPWIVKEFATYGKKISTDVANLIIELAGEDLNLLKNEIEKLVSFVGENNEIGEHDVEQLTGRSAYKTAFKLVDLVLAKRIDKILLSWESFLAREKPHQILNLLAWQFRNFIMVKNSPKNLPPEEVSGLLGINLKFARKLLEQAKHFTPNDLEKNLDIILEADFSMKSGALDPGYALEHALVGLCGLL